ncbi:DNA polymerase III subunit epsilon [Phenylobacterium sp.]|jgi:DNA polymerase-3 subunit epsilon|uniref:DNA polymerase III subunit epsilon n=1 Tax=Phenylobacterium sp. TaxID=1871053 RepID=UPI002E343E13|nr:DNA polymerase III subunit epsilon [Phenylobacterium sp.]HEX4709324.1 DNA polymerase III subunit epsilon [Phenylobacterium sp.]
MAREIVLDTETTGFEPSMGHRMVEIACLEIDDFVPTGRSFHTYIDPCRDMPPDAERVHGLSAAFLKGKPRFEHPEVVDAFLDFVGDAPLIAHNAGFDRNFINHELSVIDRAPLHEVRWVDTLALARVRFPGMHNSLDALCKRFKISLSEREKHGALVDAKLLAAVYLELRGGRERRLELTTAAMVTAVAAATRNAYGVRPRPLEPRSTEEERQIHASFIRDVVKSEELWKKHGL